MVVRLQTLGAPIAPLASRFGSPRRWALASPWRYCIPGIVTTEKSMGKGVWGKGMGTGDGMAISFPCPKFACHLRSRRLLTSLEFTLSRGFCGGHGPPRTRKRELQQAPTPRVSQKTATCPDDIESVDDELRAQYDFRSMRGVVRGKYAARYRERLRVVRLADDVADAFTDEAAVNDALRAYLRGHTAEPTRT
jgi:hypothetical protein